MTRKTAEGELEGRHAVVTGASRGIGAAIAAALAGQGASVTLMGRNEAALEKQSAAIAAAGGRVSVRTVDVSDAKSVDAAFDGLDAGFGEPAILVNNAGIALSAPFSKTDLDLWNRVMGTDLTGAFLCIRKVLPAMVKAGYGRVVNIASTAGLTGYPYVSAYCAAKHGLIGLTRALALETAKTGVTVNSVCPGYTDTDIVRSAIENIVNKTGRTEEEALAQLVSHNPQGRLIAPYEVAEAVVWLCRRGSESVTGQSIAIAGGEIL